jgi:hypothetical protein
MLEEGLQVLHLVDLSHPRVLLKDQAQGGAHLKLIIGN